MSRRRRRSKEAQARRRERRALRTGDWGSWHREELDWSQKRGWLQEVTHAWRNEVFVVLARPIRVKGSAGVHLAIRNASSTDIAWADKQRIKDELVGRDRVALEVFPTSDELVDEANMYHLWVLPEGSVLPFTLAARPRRGRPPARERV